MAFKPSNPAFIQLAAGNVVTFAAHIVVSSGLSALALFRSSSHGQLAPVFRGNLVS